MYCKTKMSMEVKCTIDIKNRNYICICINYRKQKTTNELKRQVCN